MLRLLIPLAAALLSFSCGYIGEPLPPALHIPQRVSDLSAIQKGGKILLHFTLPAQTTDNLDIRKPVSVELRVGPTSARAIVLNSDWTMKLSSDVISSLDGA